MIKGLTDLKIFPAQILKGGDIIQNPFLMRDCHKTRK